MGGGTFDSGAYASFARSTAGKTHDKIYSSRELHPDLDPNGVKVRESCDSEDNPNSTPVIVALDVTGSMGMLATNIAQKGLGVLFEGILSRKPVTDPHVMFMGVGDSECDQAPLQVSQFEADNRIVEQLKKLWIEGAGGGNGYESYHLPWYFAAFHTTHDAYVKRGRRGYLFTVGDEPPPPRLTREEIASVCGDTPEQDFTSAELLALAQRSYDVFHIMIAEGNHARSNARGVKADWAALLGQQAIWLEDHDKLAETIVSIMEVREGRDALTSSKAWGGDTARVVHDAVKNLGHAPKAKRLGGPS
jgi:hypothetical protein